MVIPGSHRNILCIFDSIVYIHVYDNNIFLSVLLIFLMLHFLSRFAILNSYIFLFL